MAKITVQDVEKVASLARLEFDAEEKQEFTYNLVRILDYIEKLNELDTTDVPPTSHVVRIKNDEKLEQGVVNGDVVKPSFPRDEVLATAPKPESGYFEVLKVIE